MNDRMEWSISVPILKNSVILRQLGLAIGIPFGIIIIGLIVFTGDSIYTQYALGLIALLFIMTYLFIKIVYKGSYQMEFVIDHDGVAAQTQNEQMKRNTKVNSLTVIFGALAGRPSVAGAGVLAQSRQKTYLKWSRVTKVKYSQRSNTIVLKGGLTESIALFCSGENYDQVERAVKEKEMEYGIIRKN